MDVNTTSTPLSLPAWARLMHLGVGKLSSRAVEDTQGDALRGDSEDDSGVRPALSRCCDDHGTAPVVAADGVMFPSSIALNASIISCL